MYYTLIPPSGSTAAMLEPKSTWSTMEIYKITSLEIATCLLIILYTTMYTCTSTYFLTLSEDPEHCYNLIQCDNLKQTKRCVMADRQTHVEKVKSRSQQGTCDMSANMSNGVIIKWLPGRHWWAFCTITSMTESNAFPMANTIVNTN